MDKQRRSRLAPSAPLSSRLAAVARVALLRARHSRFSSPRALLLLLVALGVLLTLLRSPVDVHETARVGGASSSLREEAARAVKLDGRPVMRPLPGVYPNGDANRFDCDLPSLRFACELDGEVGCRAYPQLFPAGDLLSNWSPDEPENTPKRIFSSVCRFNVSSPYEFKLAQVFHDMEVPFIAYGIPELSAAGNRWTDEYLTEKLTPTEKFKVHTSQDRHFMYYKKSAALSDETPTYESKWWTYPEFVNAVAATKQLSPSEPHDYYYFMLKQADFAQRSAFIYDELRFLDPTRAKKETPYGDLFIRDERMAQQKGMRCRLGMRGIIAEGHVDGALNMIAMVRGSKRYILSPPSVCSCLRLLSEGQSKRHTSVNWSDLEALPEDSRNCPATEVVIEQGDVLYVPSYWYHHIVSLDESIQCNIRSGLALRENARQFLHNCGLADV